MIVDILRILSLLLCKFDFSYQIWIRLLYFLAAKKQL